MTFEQDPGNRMRAFSIMSSIVELGLAIRPPKEVAPGRFPVQAGSVALSTG
jgi:hypothetical protein